MLITSVIGFLLCSSPGVVRLSDGRTFSGDIDLPAVRLYPSGKRGLRRIDPRDIALIRLWVEREELKQAWVFVEESSPEKLKLPSSYPVRRYRAEVVLRSGARLTGRLVPVSFMLSLPEEDLTFVLRCNQTGKPGQSLEDLLYVREVQLVREVPPEAALAGLEGRLPGAVRVVLLRKGGASAFRSLCNSTGRFVLEGLLPGTYDVFVVGKGALAGPNLGRPLSKAQKRQAEKVCRNAREFFPERKILLAGYIHPKEGKPALRMLVGLRRKGRTSAGNRCYLRFDLWELEKATGKWEIARRVFLFRSVEPAGSAGRFPKARSFASLSGLKLTGGANKLPDLPRVRSFLNASGGKP